jgi:hypothetical protein
MRAFAHPTSAADVTRHCEEPKATKQSRIMHATAGLLRFARNDASDYDLVQQPRYSPEEQLRVRGHDGRWGARTHAQLCWILFNHLIVKQQRMSTTCARDLAISRRQGARAIQATPLFGNKEGAGKAGCWPHPRSGCNKKHPVEPQVAAEHPASPAQWAYGLYVLSPVCRAC